MWFLWVLSASLVAFAFGAPTVDYHIQGELVTEYPHIDEHAYASELVVPTPEAPVHIEVPGGVIRVFVSENPEDLTVFFRKDMIYPSAQMVFGEGYERTTSAPESGDDSYKHLASNDFPSSYSSNDQSVISGSNDSDDSETSDFPQPEPVKEFYNSDVEDATKAPESENDFYEDWKSTDSDWSASAYQSEKESASTEDHEIVIDHPPHFHIEGEHPSTPAYHEIDVENALPSKGGRFLVGEKRLANINMH